MTRRGEFDAAEHEFQFASSCLGDGIPGSWRACPIDLLYAWTELYDAWNNPQRAELRSQIHAEIQMRKAGMNE